MGLERWVTNGATRVPKPPANTTAAIGGLRGKSIPKRIRRAAFKTLVGPDAIHSNRYYYAQSYKP
jgi:hypothetical protein